MRLRYFSVSFLYALNERNFVLYFLHSSVRLYYNLSIQSKIIIQPPFVYFYKTHLMAHRMYVWILYFINACSNKSYWATHCPKSSRGVSSLEVNSNKKWQGFFFKCKQELKMGCSTDKSNHLFLMNLGPWAEKLSFSFGVGKVEEVLLHICFLLFIFSRYLIVSACHQRGHTCTEKHSLISCVSAGQSQASGQHGPGGGLVQPHSSGWTLPNNHDWTEMEPGWVSLLSFLASDSCS